MGIEDRIAALEARNLTVEANKRWETHPLRRTAIAVITYLCAFTYMHIMALKPAFWGAFVPVGGYLLSTISLPILRRWIESRNA